MFDQVFNFWFKVCLKRNSPKKSVFHNLFIQQTKKKKIINQRSDNNPERNRLKRIHRKTNKDAINDTEIPCFLYLTSLQYVSQSSKVTLPRIRKIRKDLFLTLQ